MKKFFAVVIIGILAISIGGCIQSKKAVKSTGTDAASGAMTSAITSGGAMRVSLTQTAATDFNTESYDYTPESNFQDVSLHPLSTFSIDVDTASYANIRRFLNEGRLPPKDAVRIEEMLNYFDYAYPEPDGNAPFSIHTELGTCPWKSEHKLLKIGLKGKTLKGKERPASNIVFLTDVSGSMDMPNKLPLLKRAMKMLVEKLQDKDRVAIVVYAGASGLALSSTRCTKENKARIIDALESLKPGGSTHGSQGIELAYKIAKDNFITGGNNRVILSTDGDFNVGVTNQGDLTRLIGEKAESGIFLTVLGFGTGNLKDAMMEKLADKGNGNYGYIDTISEARKMLVEEIEGTLFTIAKDVKIQVEFNPAEIGAYRLIGYENRLLRPEDFKDDKKDAGEIGAGHRVTALYELVPTGIVIDTPKVDPLKYQKPKESGNIAAKGELLTIKLRYKEPDQDVSKQIALTVTDQKKKPEALSEDFRFAAAVAQFGMLLRDSAHKGNTIYNGVIDLAKSGKGSDEYGYRSEFIQLVRNAKELTK